MRGAQDNDISHFGYCRFRYTKSRQRTQTNADCNSYGVRANLNVAPRYLFRFNQAPNGETNGKFGRSVGYP